MLTNREKWEKLRHMVEVALGAGQLMLSGESKVFNEPAVSLKADASPVTWADKAANDYILARLIGPVLSEESKDDGLRLDAAALWIVDPLDGTKEFIAGRDDYTVNIAWVEEGSPIAGVIFAPAQALLYAGAVGIGAFKAQGDEAIQRFIAFADGASAGDGLGSDRGAGLGEGMAISVQKSEIAKNVPLTVVKSRSHGSSSLEAWLDRASEHLIRSAGIPLIQLTVGSSLKGCYVAEGSAHVYLRDQPIWEWDIAAMHAIVTAAGGVVSNLEGLPLVYNKQTPLHGEGFYAAASTVYRDYFEKFR